MAIRNLWLLVSVFFALPLAALPPPAPSAGVVERELEKEYEGTPLEPDKEAPAIQIDIPDEKLEIPDGEKIFIRDIEIEGNESISRERLVSCFEEYLNRELSLHEIYEICHVIEQIYVKNGFFLARVYPPSQNIKNEKLVIAVLEGRLGNIEVVGNKFYSESFIRSYFTSLQEKPLQYDKFLRALALLNDNNDLTVGALFEKGKAFGTADVILRVHDSRPIHLYLNGNIQCSLFYGRKICGSCQ